MTPVGAACGFTGIETFLFSILSAFIACVVLIINLTRQFALKSECRSQHLGDRTLEDEKDAVVNHKLNKVIASQALQFRMLRSIIIHMPLDSEKKDEILNMTGRGVDE